MIGLYASQKAMFFSFRSVKTVPEKVYGIVELLTGALVNGSIFGNITNLIQSMDKHAAFDKKLEKQNYRMDFLRRYMRARHFPAELQRRGMCMCVCVCAGNTYKQMCIYTEVGTDAGGYGQQCISTMPLSGLDIAAWTRTSCFPRCPSRCDRKHAIICTWT